MRIRMRINLRTNKHGDMICGHYLSHFSQVNLPAAGENFKGSQLALGKMSEVSNIYRKEVGCISIPISWRFNQPATCDHL